ncbi:hypothetical protein NEFER03_0838 [Nematocida sp. LUAm3]|nr:hypothetical protein NEFER03_0838 [Nematocida sp. LUAm3]KAI5174856.1 hypothetical protein NEFER02_0956 [Nematocida sp. LUAm2]KAI5177546.1 hypothetical protein NEFER01_0796 [Nematocida sp. LUAm1]
MSSQGRRGFMFSNELTRALELLVEAHKNSILMHEILSIVQMHRLHTMKVLHSLKPLIKKEDKCGEEALIMLLGVYCAFPDLIETHILLALCKTIPESKTVLLLIFKVLLCFYEIDGNMDIAMFLEQYIDQRMGKDTELDYLFISLICVITEKGKINNQLITMIQDKIEKVSNKTLSPKLIYLSGLSSLQYTLPISYLSIDNPILYIRIMDAICFCGSICEKERFLQIIPKEKDQFEQIFSRYIHKEELPFMYNSLTDDQNDLYNVYCIPKVLREFVENPNNTKEEIEKIKDIIRTYLLN